MDWEGIEPSTSALRMQRYTTKPPALTVRAVEALFLLYTCRIVIFKTA
ncbi:hypothetical protein NUZ5A_20279 [Candidatus Nitrosotenuis uzonensis]|uniref:Uncharacterized protein n=1 Tax=Candidatus Nitrosotenuis uzonensis TaxID=1407055 RepID=A0A812EWQ3_9ARCH|nr:hypothetical protein NUZ5A_20279 [Candidatus Nitrosotenuis uzonensis]